MKSALFIKRIAVTASLVLCFGGIPLLAQRGQGGRPESAGGGQGRMAAPGQMSMPSNQGMPSKPSEGMPATGPGKPAGTGPAASSKPTEEKRTVAQQLSSNTKLSGQLQGFFPTGTNLSNEAVGFKNLGEFVAAAHVSHNLDIPFGELKGRILSGKSLGQSIHELKPDVDSAAEAKRAEAQAKKTLKASKS